MQAEPFLPSNKSSLHTSCPQSAYPQDGIAQSLYTSASRINYQEKGWESRLAADWSFFQAEKTDGKILLIDIKNWGNQRAYRYLANANTQNMLYEPWSSSKVFAISGAMAKLRMAGIASNGQIGDTLIADMITSIHSYERTGDAPADSNALATYFANLAQRDYLTDLFHDEWLGLNNPDVFFRGAYGPVAFKPSKTISIERYSHAYDDPGYLPYRCEKCGLTGNKPMTTLAQAEWLKRLALHQDEPSTQQPHLAYEDVQLLFYGKTEQSKHAPFGGMMMGISTVLQDAIADAISPDSTDSAKMVLDRATRGEWRVFQKIGWGPSETRGTAENVVLAHVCLPYYQGGLQFTVAAQAAVQGDSEENVYLAGEKMQRLLVASLKQYFNN